MWHSYPPPVSSLRALSYWVVSLLPVELSSWAAGRMKELLGICLVQRYCITESTCRILGRKYIWLQRVYNFSSDVNFALSLYLSPVKKEHIRVIRSMWKYRWYIIDGNKCSLRLSKLHCLCNLYQDTNIYLLCNQYPVRSMLEKKICCSRPFVRWGHLSRNAEAISRLGNIVDHLSFQPLSAWPIFFSMINVANAN